MIFDYFNITRSYHKLDLVSVGGGDYWPGVGINMQNADSPKRTIGTCFKNNQREEAKEPIKINDIIASNIFYIETENDYEEAKRLYASFKANYGFDSFSASLNYVRKENKYSHSIYLIIENKLNSDTLTSLDTDWNDFFKKNENNDNDTLLSLFLNTYGSHYIETLNNGWRLMIRAKVMTTSSQEIKNFSGKMKAAIGFLKAKGSIDVTLEKQLKTFNFEVTGNIVGEVSGSGTILTSFESVKNFLAGLHSQNIKINQAPMNALIHSYWHILPQNSKLFTILSEKEGQHNDSPFGVPQGTIIAWNPDINNPGLKNKEITLESVIPEGWAICNGLNNTPDLVNRFIKGIADYSELHIKDGNEVHSHTGNVPGNVTGGVAHYDRGDKSAAGYPHGHGSININKSSNIPPFYSLIYIMKL